MVAEPSQYSSDFGHSFKMKINEISLYFNGLRFHLSILPKSNYLPLCCFSGLAHADLKELSYRNVHTDSDGNTWLVGNRVKTKAPYVVKLLPIAVELIEKYRGVNEFKVSSDRVFPVGEIGSMEDSLKRIGEKAGCSVRVSPHVGRHTFATLALSKGMPLETLQKVLGHKTIISTQVYAELINPKIGEDTDRMREKIGGMFRLAN